MSVVVGGEGRWSLGSLAAGWPPDLGQVAQMKAWFPSGILSYLGVSRTFSCRALATLCPGAHPLWMRRREQQVGEGWAALERKVTGTGFFSPGSWVSKSFHYKSHRVWHLSLHIKKRQNRLWAMFVWGTNFLNIKFEQALKLCNDFIFITFPQNPS